VEHDCDRLARRGVEGPPRRWSDRANGGIRHREIFSAWNEIAISSRSARSTASGVDAVRPFRTLRSVE
jgi:hypothetical protein